MDPFVTPIMRLLRNAAQFPTKHLLLLRVLFSTLLLLLLRQVPSVISSDNDAMFKRVSLTGTYLKMYATQDFSHYQPRSPGICAFWCLERQDESPACEAFELNTNGTCDFYEKMTLDDNFLVGVTDRHVFLNERNDVRKGVFHDIQLRGKQFSIYMSPVYREKADARKHCSDIGGYLLEFDSLDEYDAVKMVTGDLTNKVYVGAKLNKTLGLWVTDRAGSPINQSNLLWKDSHPRSSGGIKAAFLELDIMQLSSFYDFTNKLFLCERDVSP